MNNDALRDAAKIAALTAVVNLLLREVAPSARNGVASGLLDEVERIAEGDGALKAEMLSYIDKALTSLKP